jgi:hypothetical protein
LVGTRLIQKDITVVYKIGDIVWTYYKGYGVWGMIVGGRDNGWAAGPGPTFQNLFKVITTDSTVRIPSLKSIEKKDVEYVQEMPESRIFARPEDSDTKKPYPEKPRPEYFLKTNWSVRGSSKKMEHT